MGPHNKTGKSNSTAWIVGLGIVALVIAGMNQGWFSQAPTAPTSGGTTTTSGQLKTCDSTTTPQPTFTGINSETGGTITGEGFSYRKSGTKGWKDGRLGTAITPAMQPEVEYEFMFGVNATEGESFLGRDLFYGPYMKYVVPCSENPDEEVDVYNDEVEGSITTRFLNNIGDSTVESFAAGEVKAVTVSFRAGVDEVFGNPLIATSTIAGFGINTNKQLPNTLCVGLHNPDWDKVDSIQYAGSPLPKLVGAPENFNTSNLNTTVSCYAAPIIKDSWSNFEIFLDADNSVNPGNQSGDCDIATQASSAELYNSSRPTMNTVWLFPADFWADDSSGNIYWGTEDDEGNQTAANVPFVTCLIVN